MALRELITGGAGCAAPGAGPSSSNPISGLVDSLIGGGAKAQERLRELPGLVDGGEQHAGFQEQQFFEAHDEGRAIHNAPQVEQFMRGFQGHDAGFEQAWNQHQDAWHPSAPPGVDQQDFAPFNDFDRIYEEAARPTVTGDGQPVTRNQLLESVFQSFFASGRSAMPFQVMPLPQLGLSMSDKERIRNRTSIVGRHLFAVKGDAFADAQVNALLQSLDIDGRLDAPAGHFAEFDDLYDEATRAQHMERAAAANANAWAQDFQRMHHVPQAQQWADEFQQQGAASWADEFDQGRGAESWAQEFAQTSRPQSSVANLHAMEQTRALENTLRQNSDPKFQNSNFLKFVSKMSRGEIAIEDNKAVERPAAQDWAHEFAQQRTDGDWAEEFQAQRVSGANDWASEFERSQPSGDQWVDEFNGIEDTSDAWIEQFSNSVADATQEWDSVWNDIEQAESKWQYRFAKDNPYMTHPDPLREGQELFRSGVLNEAVLALEAEVQKNPESMDGWRLLGIANAENDDDIQAISAMTRALRVDPSNLEVLLSLGVSHTNELDQKEALGYLTAWLQYHPRYGSLATDQVDRSNAADVIRLFSQAAEMHPGDADVHTVLGVLYNLSRNYTGAIDAFERALELKPRDYSLWNKLGATKANSSRSAEAVDAYQQALNLKPNYVRAWSNMGIGYANQGRYEESAAYYVRALQMNPHAENVWGYLRISLSCAERTDLNVALDARDVQRLAQEFPL